MAVAFAAGVAAVVAGLAAHVVWVLVAGGFALVGAVSAVVSGEHTRQAPRFTLRRRDW